MVDILTRGDTFFTQYKSTNNHMRFGMCLVGHSLCCPVVWWKFCRRFRGSTRRSNPQDSHLSSLLSFLVFFFANQTVAFCIRLSRPSHADSRKCQGSDTFVSGPSQLREYQRAENVDPVSPWCVGIWSRFCVLSFVSLCWNHPLP